MNVSKVCDFTQLDWTLGVDWCLPRENVTEDFHNDLNHLGLWLRVFKRRNKNIAGGKVTQVPDATTMQDACLVTGVRALTSKEEVEKMLEDYPNMAWAVSGPGTEKAYAGSLLSTFDQDHLHVRLMFVSEQLRLSCS